MFMENLKVGSQIVISKNDISMKKIFFYFVLLAATVIATASCSKEEPAPTETTQTGMVLHATVDQTAATRASLSDGDTWTFAFSQNDAVFVRNKEMSPDKHWMFTKGADDFTCPAAITAKSATDWYAYFPQVIVYLFQQSGKKEDVANLYALSGTTAGPTTGEDGLSIAMAPQVAILVIDNQKGSIDINVKSGPNSWVHSLEAKTDEAGFDLVTEETKVSLLTTDSPGTYYIAVPAGVQLCIKDGDTEIKSTITDGFTAGKYYELTVAAPPTFTVTFDLNGKPGTAPERIENLLSGANITKPSSPTAEGYVFIGWYKDKECKALWNFYADVVTANTTLYAGWTDELISGKFTINSEGKQVYFTKGNLWADDFDFLHFEDSQWDSYNSYSLDHTSYFTWSSSVSLAAGPTGYGSNLFCDENHKVSVNGIAPIYYALTKDEWKYLFRIDDSDRNVREMKYGSPTHSCNIIYCGTGGLVIYPDDYNGDPLSQYIEYTEETFPEGCVFLPGAGWRDDYTILDVGHSIGFYWSSSADFEHRPYNVLFYEDGVSIGDPGNKDNAFSIRLVANCE